MLESAEQASEFPDSGKSVLEFMDDFRQMIFGKNGWMCVPTGFPLLDEYLEGGLRESFYIIGAISSLGKTTFVLQMADQIAKSGQDVLIFSLEMPRKELMAKSISRHTFQIAVNERMGVQAAKTMFDILRGEKYKDYSKDEIELISRAVNEYKQYAEHIFITEGKGNLGVSQIREAVDRHIKIMKSVPVVIVDYLQILYPFSEKMNDKQNTDKTVTELKRISRDFRAPVIGISSFNRSNYSSAVTMESFKESGSIEYSSDILMGIQLQGTGQKGFDVNEAKRKNPREIELVILKNRNGRTGDKISYKYYPEYNYFRESTKKQWEQ